MRLVDRTPHLDADALASRFQPPHRFELVRFNNYIPASDYPTQAESRDALVQFANSMTSNSSKRRWWNRSTAEDETKPARYLDGGFGTGKTHLLASLWHAAPTPKAYLTFTELTAF